ncbi:uncharacterized protein [Nicotiana tomentosiformis]|uniref:uncharacterized protein n=1 Tax=Nicotiana tomentosiformis TaxID=4098 RepID=UPI00388CC8A6
MAPYEALYSRRCRSPIGRFKAGETNLLGPDLVQEAIDKVQLIMQRLFNSQSRQKSYADKRRRDFSVHNCGQSVPTSLSYERCDAVWEKRQAEPQVLEAPTIPLDEKLSYEEELMAIVDRQVRKLRSKETVFVKVLWRNHTVEEATWEVEDAMRVKYPYLFQSTENLLFHYLQ